MYTNKSVKFLDCVPVHKKDLVSLFILYNTEENHLSCPAINLA